MVDFHVNNKAKTRTFANLLEIGGVTALGIGGGLVLSIDFTPLNSNAGIQAVRQLSSNADAVFLTNEGALIVFRELNTSILAQFSTSASILAARGFNTAQDGVFSTNAIEILQSLVTIQNGEFSTIADVHTIRHLITELNATFSTSADLNSERRLVFDESGQFSTNDIEHQLIRQLESSLNGNFSTFANASVVRLLNVSVSGEFSTVGYIRSVRKLITALAGSFSTSADLNSERRLVFDESGQFSTMGLYFNLIRNLSSSMVAAFSTSAPLFNIPRLFLSTQDAEFLTNTGIFHSSRLFRSEGDSAVFDTNLINLDVIRKLNGFCAVNFITSIAILRSDRRFNTSVNILTSTNEPEIRSLNILDLLNPDAEDETDVKELLFIGEGENQQRTIEIEDDIRELILIK